MSVPHVDPTHTTVRELKQDIFARRHIPPQLQRLVFGNQELRDFRLLSDYGITSGCEVKLVHVLPAANVLPY